MSKDLLLELGTEEIPAGFMDYTFKQLTELSKEIFSNNRIEIGEIQATGTPRRLVLLIKDVAEKQSDLEKEVRGPAVRIAFDEEGNPSKAGAGFACGQGISPEELEVRDEYVYACTRELGEDTKKLLAELLTEIINKLNFPKSMRWASEEMRFARPIKWILSLYGEDIVDLSVAGVKASNWSKGHRFLSEGQIVIDSPAEYFAKLEKEFVIVDHNRRREMIVEQIEAIAQKKDVVVKVDEGLLTEVNFLVEYPTALCGSFSEDFLELPSEVLITSMREHQRYFPVEDKKGNLQNLFVTVRNGNEEHIDVVRAGNEKVLQARLSDAIFFYEEDQEETLATKVDKLKNVIFQEDLGTIYEKVERIVSLSGEFANQLGLSEDKVEQAKRAAKLSKADLVTGMVDEFSKLQGVMGSYYALNDGEDEEVASAIFEHYLPRYADDILPSTEAGIIVSIADKIDSIVGFFSVGIIPTGSQDPYALRRQAQGIVKIIVDAGLELDLDYLIEQSLATLKKQDKLQRDGAEVKAEVLDFFKLRLENLLEEAEVRYDVSDAILASNFININDTLIRATALMEYREDEGFEELITAFNRVANLASKSNNTEINPELFEDDSERELYSAYQNAKDKIDSLVAERAYVEALTEVAKLKEPIDNFFDSVMVMAKNEEVKENRLGLLNSISNLLAKIADLTKIVID
ncbi:glycyl-tRNA synthetase beta chain [Orenia metallireducens]|uniref:Glycine--tRNA ligase beta subunit n=1 Tax=Orenia metallireducens TaxID=1413210 RepID=A0A285G5U7_9FIRM|nr:glycine--tRNA ligase subunit beta [Orenia metallireducens]PRX28328.1 glycyl-tRNA synthetase beta chain [Orenia metallireducens]SNY18895.1 glycyl-tRNA synthetase beta chain [Orenia metallireducens]